MTPYLDLGILLLDKYNPADDSPSRFRQAYKQLVDYRDKLRKKHEAKEERRGLFEQAGAPVAAPELKGNPYGVLAGDDDGSAIAPSTKHVFAVSLTEAQVNQLALEDRKVQVDKMKEDIKYLKKGKSEGKKDEKKKRDAVGAEQKEAVERERAKQEGETAELEESQDEAMVQTQDEVGDSELGQGWKTPKRRGKR